MKLSKLFKTVFLLTGLSTVLLVTGCEYQKKEEDTKPDVVVEKTEPTKPDTIVVETPETKVESPTEVKVENPKEVVVETPVEASTSSVDTSKDKVDTDVPNTSDPVVEDTTEASK